MVLRARGPRLHLGRRRPAWRPTCWKAWPPTASWRPTATRASGSRMDTLRDMRYLESLWDRTRRPGTCGGTDTAVASLDATAACWSPGPPACSAVGWSTRLLDRGASVVCLVQRLGRAVSRFVRDGPGGPGRAWSTATSAIRPCFERVLGEREIDTVFHLAAQTIVAIANRNPVSTFETNIARHLERARGLPPQPAGAGRSWSRRPTRPTATNRSCPTPRTCRSEGRHPYDASKSCADLLAQTYAHTYGSARGDHPVRQLLRGRRPELESHRPGTIRVDPARGSTSCRSAPMAASSATTSTSRMAQPRTCWPGRGRWPSGPSWPGDAVQLLAGGAAARCWRWWRGSCRWPWASDLEPVVRGEPAHEIETQYLDAQPGAARARLEPTFGRWTRDCAHHRLVSRPTSRPPS